MAKQRALGYCCCRYRTKLAIDVVVHVVRTLAEVYVRRADMQTGEEMSCPTRPAVILLCLGAKMQRGAGRNER